MAMKKFDEQKFMDLLKNPSTLDSEMIILNKEGVLPKKEKE